MMFGEDMLENHDAIVAPEHLIAEEEGGNAEGAACVRFACRGGEQRIGVRIGEQHRELRGGETAA